MRSLLRHGVLLLALAVTPALAGTAAPDPVAENMLLLQTASGGWSKHYQRRAVDYAHVFTDAERQALRSPGRSDDATIDNRATTQEIRYLADAWARTRDARYLDAASRGVEYLLAAQYPNGGWPQYFPDRSLYRQQVTFNDDAMTRVLDLLQDVVEGKGTLVALTPRYADQAGQALARGLDCVLATQVRLQGTPTIWAAQYDSDSLQPAKARAYELPSLAVAESVGVMRLLMRQTDPSPAVLRAVEDGARWLQAHRLPDLARRKVAADDEETGQDVLIVDEPGASLWARFHDLETQQPMFVNRAGEQVARFTDMPNERRVGYAWHGTWPQALLQDELPRWRTRHAAALQAMQQQGPPRPWRVAADGSGDFATLQQALDAVPQGNALRQLIVLGPGLYRGVVRIPAAASHVTLRGAGAGATRISWDNHAKRIDPATGAAFGTSGSATLFVHGDAFIAEDLTIENTAGPVGQALALSVRAPRAGFRNVRLLGHQDTLYTHTGSVVHFKDCYIEGSVDYIFGGATALFDDCTLFSKGGHGYITAASTPQDQRFGYVFRRALVRGEGVATTWLGRPWRDHARVVFVDSDLGANVVAAGWHDWNKPQARATAFYAEARSRGPGAAAAARAGWSRQLDDTAAAGYTRQAVLGDWNPFDVD